MGQTTRSQGISFTHEMWNRIDRRCSQLKCGRSRYFQMLVESDFIFVPEIHAHKGDGQWHFYPENILPGAAQDAAESEDDLPDPKGAGNAPGSTRSPRGRVRPG